MKQLILLIGIWCALTVCGLAQDKKPQAAPLQLQPKPLTEAQVGQLANAQQALRVAEAEAQAAQERLAKIRAQIDSLAKGFFIESGLSAQHYQPVLQVIDPQANSVGFLPKPEAPKKSEEKKN